MRLRNAAGTTVSASGEQAERMLVRGWRQVGGDLSVAAAVPDPTVGQLEPAKVTSGGHLSPPPPEGVTTLASLAVLDGTAKEVVEWVGDDPARALAALQAEQAKGDDARSTLVAKLVKIAEQ